MTALGGIVWSVLKYKRDTNHNHSIDTLDWTQTAFKQMQDLRAFYEDKLAEYDKRLEMQEAKCHAEMDKLREENERCVANMRERIEKLEKQNHDIVKDVMANGGCIKPLDGK